MEAPSDPNWPAVKQGAGHPVVFLHGYPLDHTIWDPQLHRPLPGHRYVALDLPGYGLAADSSVPETLSGFAESVNQTLGRRIREPVTVVGHSFGGYIALEMFRAHPERFAALVLTNTRSDPDTPEAKEKRLRLVRSLEDPAQGLDIEATARALLSPATWEAAGPVARHVLNVVRRAKTPALLGALKAIASRPDLTPLLATISVPVLVIWGEEDQLIPPAQSQKMMAHLRGAQHMGIPGAGHLPCLEAPSAFGKALERFLRSRISP
ncbi:MAG TPA: alpha/beta hydrolase [Thermoplasmata archaeon]|nr:alpha/beta hydrolase [Thermoplasmata archaeon]